jgi:hypothetical protein
MLFHLNPPSTEDWDEIVIYWNGRFRQIVEIQLISNYFFSSFIFDSFVIETLDPNVLRWLLWFLQDPLPKSPTLL